MTAPVTPEPIRVKILPSEVDKSTITKALFSIAVTATTIAVMVYLERKLSGPDAFLAMKMRALHGVQEVAVRQARFWHDVSARAGDMYLSSRP